MDTDAARAEINEESLGPDLADLAILKLNRFHPKPTDDRASIAAIARELRGKQQPHHVESMERSY